MTKIQWTEKTWNPIVGCSKVSEGCRNCYAIQQAYRNNAMGAKLDNPGRLAYYERLTEKRGDRVEWTGVVNFVPEALEIPLKTKKPTTWFVNSMSDLFHESVEDEWIDQVFAVMALTPQHIYQVLTKRPEGMLEYMQGSETRIFKQACGIADDSPKLKEIPHQWPLPNVWLGVSVENQKAADERIPLLLKTPAAIRFLSCEPLLEEVDLIRVFDGSWYTDCLNGVGAVSGKVDWVIAGGESGHNARYCDAEWIRSIVCQCKDAEVPVFVKQMGSDSSFILKGKGDNPDEWPEDLRIREVPS